MGKCKLQACGAASRASKSKVMRYATGAALSIAPFRMPHVPEPSRLPCPPRYNTTTRRVEAAPAPSRTPSCFSHSASVRPLPDVSIDTRRVHEPDVQAHTASTQGFVCIR